ncbi:MAG: hypothetical protein JSV61_04820 [Anaerolineales bacterium]|nr:MAG: hypothetical protein JSV61_04820 [Anaerolineales bacterium]
MHTTNESNQTPQVGAGQTSLLERLCNASAVSGDEHEVRQIVIQELQPYAQAIKIDSLGNVLVTREGRGTNRLRVMVAAHMDEAGFILTNDEDDGIYRFEVVGGMDVRFLLGKLVWVGRSHTPGVIGAKPVHLLTSEEKKKTITLDSLRIDLGPGNGNQSKIGERAVFATPFIHLGNSLRARALDNRLGVATLIELVKHPPDNIDLLAAFTVQEEVGTRGASIAGYSLNPDLAFVLDCTSAYDLPAWDDSENSQYNTQLGAGPAIHIAHKPSLSDPRLVRHLEQTAKVENIPYQIRQPGSVSTDTGTIHKQRSGIPSVTVSVPGRYLHSPASLCRLSDWQFTLALIHAALARLTPQVLATER